MDSAISPPRTSISPKPRQGAPMASRDATGIRYQVRDLSRSDLGRINTWRNDPEVQKWLISPFRYVSPETDDRWFDHYLEARAGNIRLAICEGESGELVGAVYLLNIDWVARTGELGILIGERGCQGRGAGEFGSRRILQHAFEDLNLHRVELNVLANNARAMRLYRKVGLVEEGRARQAVFKNGEYLDLIRMGILSTEYNRRDARDMQ
jgi:RimJ/RimL family protein N-acetyltransferase